MSVDIRLGVALELDTSQYGAENLESIGFLEYGLSVSDSLPNWLVAMHSRHQADLHLHPLDVNLAGNDVIDDWLITLREIVDAHQVRALVSDLGFWHLGPRNSTWERPALFSMPVDHSRSRISTISNVCGIPFRVENPPVDWMPGRPCLWSYLEKISNDDNIEICLDLCHLVQYQANVAGSSKSQLPDYFPWDKITEIHLGGCVVVEYLGQKMVLDNHLAAIDDAQHELLWQIISRKSSPVDICLEMEPCSPASFRHTAARILTRNYALD